ncbi:MAG: metallophosphoesterase [Candidatus Pacearchaeota archaeon]|nr:metallophosphoesterase [Candidatus Pacearchaeota archaeon]
MKLLCIPDLHGKKPMIPKEDFDAIVCIGDICSDKGIRKLTKEWMRYIEKHPEEVLTDDVYFERKIGKNGLKKLERESLERGNELLKYLDKFGKPIFFVPGNWDQSYGKTRIKDMDKNSYSYLKGFYDFWLGDELNKKLVNGVKNLVDCQYKLNEFMGFNFIGYGLSSAPEEIRRRRKRDYTKPEFEKLKKSYWKIVSKLGKTYEKRNKKLPTIFLTHNVPYGTKIDILKNKKSKNNGKHFGSTIARLFCKKQKPLFCIGGHMHEHFGKDKIGNTILVNVGFGRGKAVVVELVEGKIKKLRFYGKGK